MAEKKSQSVRNDPARTKPGEEPLGAYLTAVREKRGVSRQDVSREAHVPQHYVTMIETDDYALISDQLYMLPFLRRYATFVGLDAEEVASRFVRDVQRADVTASRMSEPIPMADGKRSSLRPAAIAIVFGALIVGAVFVGWHMLAARFMHLGARQEPAVAESPTAASSVSAASQPASSPAPVAPAAIASEVVAVPAAAASH
ncbi:MAG TPA: helix-turn-helix domain-containing protein, partial [Candidatus Binataceae bacterium]|nr:helix-turn-helix domain-containing protein [Candidatus Binataceae bacterium]